MVADLPRLRPGSSAAPSGNACHVERSGPRPARSQRRQAVVRGERQRDHGLLPSHRDALGIVGCPWYVPPSPPQPPGVSRARRQADSFLGAEPQRWIYVHRSRYAFDRMNPIAGRELRRVTYGDLQVPEATPCPSEVEHYTLVRTPPLWISSWLGWGGSANRGKQSEVDHAVNSYEGVLFDNVRGTQAESFVRQSYEAIGKLRAEDEALRETNQQLKARIKTLQEQYVPSPALFLLFICLLRYVSDAGTPGRTLPSSSRRRCGGSDVRARRASASTLRRTCATCGPRSTRAGRRGRAARTSGLGCWRPWRRSRTRSASCANP